MKYLIILLLTSCISSYEEIETNPEKEKLLHWNAYTSIGQMFVRDVNQLECNHWLGRMVQMGEYNGYCYNPMTGEQFNIRRD